MDNGAEINLLLFLLTINISRIQKWKDNVLFITLVPKVFDNVFLLVGLITLETSVNFDLLVHYVECSNVLKTDFNLRKG